MSRTRALYALDRLEEADDLAGRAAELGAIDDAFTQMLWRQVRAKVLILGGKPDEAAAALEQALARYERKGNLVSAGRARVRLAELEDAAQRRSRSMRGGPTVRAAGGAHAGRADRCDGDRARH